MTDRRTDRQTESDAGGLKYAQVGWKMQLDVDVSQPAFSLTTCTFTNFSLRSDLTLAPFSFHINYCPVIFVQSQTDGQTDRKWCVRAHRALAQVGSINLMLWAHLPVGFAIYGQYPTGYIGNYGKLQENWIPIQETMGNSVKLPETLNRCFP